MIHRSGLSTHIAKIASVAVAAAMLAACGTAPTSLRPMAQPSTLQLQSPVRWVRPATFIDFNEYMAAGTYTAVGESDRGTYYVGPSPCLVEILMPKDKAVPPKNAVARDCGIFRPRAPGAAPTVFFVADGTYSITEFTADGTPRLDRLGQHIGLDHRADDVTPPPPGTPGQTVTIPAPVGASQHPMATGVGSGIGAGIVNGIVAADAGTYHEAPTQPPAGWLEAALATVTK
jgi:hypothetical protein